MAWTAPVEADVMSEFTADEAATIAATQGAVDNLPAILGRVVEEIRDAIRSGGYDLATDATTIPGGLHNACIDLARWRLLVSFPQLKSMQSQERADAAKRADAKLEKISRQEYVPEPPAAGVEDRGGNWNSRNKLIMRTDPVPTPGSQLPST